MNTVVRGAAWRVPARMNRATISPEDSLSFMIGFFFDLWFGAGFKSRDGLGGRKTSTTWLGRIECIARNFRRGSGINIAHPWPAVAENYEAPNEPSAGRSVLLARQAARWLISRWRRRAR